MISLYLKSRLFWHFYWNFWLPSFVLSSFLFRGMVQNGIPTVCFYIFSTERNSELFSLPLKDSEGNSESMLQFLYPRKGIPSCFLFRWSVWKGIPRVRFYFCSTERNSELFSLPRKGSERNSEVFCSSNSRNSIGNNHLFRLFRLLRNYFFVGNSQPYLQLSALPFKPCYSQC